jgi:hypothetical protein
MANTRKRARFDQSPNTKGSAARKSAKRSQDIRTGHDLCVAARLRARLMFDTATPTQTRATTVLLSVVVQRLVRVGSKGNASDLGASKQTRQPQLRFDRARFERTSMRILRSPGRAWDGVRRDIAFLRAAVRASQPSCNNLERCFPPEKSRDRLRRAAPLMLATPAHHNEDVIA